MYIPDETVLELYKMLGEIPTKYGAKPSIILADVIQKNEKIKAEKEQSENDNNLSVIQE